MLVHDSVFIHLAIIVIWSGARGIPQVGATLLLLGTTARFMYMTALSSRQSRYAY